MSFWNGTPTWLRWSLIVSVLGFFILLSNAKDAINNLHSWTPVTWGGLAAWAVPLISERDMLIAQLETRLQANFNDVAWTQLIYRTQDLDFQVELLKNTRTMLQATIAANPGEVSANEFRQARMDEIDESIERKVAESTRINCLIEHRNQPSGASRC